MARKKISFDPADESIIDAIRDFVDEHGIPPGDLINFSILKTLLRMSDGDEDFETTESNKHLRYKRRIDLSDLIDEFKSRFGR